MSKLSESKDPAASDLKRELPEGFSSPVYISQPTMPALEDYTDLLNPDFAKLADVIGFAGRKVTRVEDLEAAVRAFLAEPGPALLDVHTNPTELVMPPTVEASQVVDTALYAAKAVLSGRISDVEKLLVDNFVK